MGEYCVVVNLDKREYLMPHVFGDGSKLSEFGSNSQGTMTVLAHLLFAPGGWAGDRIVIAGDSYNGTEVYERAIREFEDVSEDMLDLCRDDLRLRVKRKSAPMEPKGGA